MPEVGIGVSDKSLNREGVGCPNGLLGAGSNL